MKWKFPFHEMTGVPHAGIPSSFHGRKSRYMANASNCRCRRQGLRVLNKPVNLIVDWELMKSGELTMKYTGIALLMFAAMFWGISGGIADILMEKGWDPLVISFYRGAIVFGEALSVLTSPDVWWFLLLGDQLGIVQTLGMVIILVTITVLSFKQAG